LTNRILTDFTCNLNTDFVIMIFVELVRTRQFSFRHVSNNGQVLLEFAWNCPI